MDGELIPLAKALVTAGVCCIPIELPSKQPYKNLKWKEFQERRPTLAECEKFWANGAGIALVAGVISGNLELLDFDVPGKSADGYTPVADPPAWKPFLAILKEHGHEELAKRVLIHKTPSGGKGMLYRCPGPALPGNTRLAATAKNEVLIETRGQGGYFGVAPSTGYKLLNGDLTAIPVITPEEREILLSAARLLDERTIDTYDKQVRSERAVGGVYGDTPADWYNANGPHLLDTLEGHGWKECGRAGQRIALVRPGKSAGKGISGTVTADGGCFWCFSTSTGFKNEYAYSKFSVYAQLEFNGDMHEAARTIRREMMPKTSIQKQTQTQLQAEIVTVEERRGTQWRKASSIVPEKVDWLLPPYLPVGEVTILVGDPGVGKSTLAQAICTAVTLGGKVNGIPVEAGNVVFMSAEQSVRQITVPRFIAMGADLDRITLPDEDEDDGTVKPFILDAAGFIVLREQVIENEAKLLVIDTATAYLEAVRNMNTANEVREWMRRIISIARGCRCAALVLMHPNKSMTTNALHKVMGSIDFVGAARSVLYAGADPDDNTVRAADHIKSNVGPIGKPLGFSITEESGFMWLADSTLTADRILEAPQTREAKGKRDACEEWLRSYLSDSIVLVDAIMEEAKSQGFGRNMVYELKSKLGVRIIRPEFQGKVSWTLIREVSGERWDQK